MMEKLSKMNNDVRLNVLRETALELQEICNFNPPFRSKGKTEEQVTAWLKEATPLLEPKDQESISNETEDILTQLGFWPFEEKEDAEEVEESTEATDNPDIIAEIKTASTVRILKDIARTYDEFKSIRGELSSYTKADDLRQMMLDMLNPEGVEKKEEKKEVVKKTESKVVEKKTGIASKGVSKQEKIDFLTPLIKAEKYKKSEIVDKCVKQFPQYAKTTWQTLLTDAKNPKYSIFDPLVMEDGRGIFKFKEE
jgi:hypothetical protein